MPLDHSDLLPCPFCGGEAHYEPPNIACQSCGCRLPWCKEFWNRRDGGRGAAMTIACREHRACCGVEHDPANGKLHGCCVICGVPWPCDVAKRFGAKDGALSTPAAPGPAGAEVEQRVYREDVEISAQRAEQAETALENSARLFINKNAEFLAAMRMVDDLKFALTGAGSDRTTRRMFEARMEVLNQDLAKIRTRALEQPR